MQDGGEGAGVSYRSTRMVFEDVGTREQCGWITRQPAALWPMLERFCEDFSAKGDDES